MATKLAATLVLLQGLFSPACFGDAAARQHYTPIQYLKNYALSSCIADGYQAKELVDDAIAAANGYKELGSLDINAYNEAVVLGKSFLSREYKGQKGDNLALMKCIDFFHSKELDRLARKYSTKK